jgi:cyclophilin family peptidyl-prolyl cis-trans isomerase
MSQFTGIRKTTAAICLLGLAVSAAPAQATIVRFQTSLGSIDVRLYDERTPLNVANFLNYVTNNRYDGTFIHRSIPGFVIQGGGYFYNAQNNTAPHIQQFDQVMNEPGISNLRGTIAMAKLPPPEDGGPINGGPNSATSEWFFNLSNNNAIDLDVQNGGFTVFGRAVGNGMNIVDAIAALPRFDLDPPPQETFDTVPLRNGSGLANRLVFVSDVQVLNVPRGDYSFDGAANANDYAVWRQTFGATTIADADGTGNLRVDAADYVLWRKSVASGAAGSLSPILAALPEPSGTSMAMVASLLFSARRTRRR